MKSIQYLFISVILSLIFISCSDDPLTKAQRYAKKGSYGSAVTVLLTIDSLDSDYEAAQRLIEVYKPQIKEYVPAASRKSREEVAIEKLGVPTADSVIGKWLRPEGDYLTGLSIFYIEKTPYTRHYLLDGSLLDVEQKETKTRQGNRRFDEAVLSHGEFLVLLPDRRLELYNAENSLFDVVDCVQ